MEPTMILRVCQCVLDHGLCSMGQYFKKQDSQGPLGCP